jgi:hypothetical protein
MNHILYFLVVLYLLASSLPFHFFPKFKTLERVHKGHLLFGRAAALCQKKWELLIGRTAKKRCSAAAVLRWEEGREISSKAALNSAVHFSPRHFRPALRRVLSSFPLPKSPFFFSPSQISVLHFCGAGNVKCSEVYKCQNKWRNILLN